MGYGVLVDSFREQGTDFRLRHKSTLRVCFSESACKIKQNGGRVVANGSIFDRFREPGYWGIGRHFKGMGYGV